MRFRFVVPGAFGGVDADQVVELVLVPAGFLEQATPAGTQGSPPCRRRAGPRGAARPLTVRRQAWWFRPLSGSSVKVTLPAWPARSLKVPPADRCSWCQSVRSSGHPCSSLTSATWSRRSRTSSRIGGSAMVSRARRWRSKNASWVWRASPGISSSRLGVQEAGSGGGRALRCRVDPGLLQDLPHGGGGDLDARYEEFTVDAAIAPARILSCQAQDQLADGADGAWPARASGAGAGCVAAREQVAMPAQHRVQSDQKPEPAGDVPREPAQQGGQERSAGGGNRGRVVPSCRSRTVIWWRRTKISTSFSLSVIGSISSNANAFVTAR
jgi:hypothetical protein